MRSSSMTQPDPTFPPYEKGESYDPFSTGEGRPSIQRNRKATAMSYVNCNDFAIDLLNRADALRTTDMFLSRSDLDRAFFLRTYTVIDGYVQQEEEGDGIDEVIIDDMDALLSEWEDMLMVTDGITADAFYEEVYA